jgi:tetratricopeptide (TPR) repeat protein
MKIAIFLFFALNICLQVSAQQLPPGFPANLPPEALKMYKKMMSENGMKIPDEMGRNGNDPGDAPGNTPLVDIPPYQVPPYTPSSSPKFDYSPFGSGRTDAQRKAMLLVINGELRLKPFILPKKENAPSKSEILKIAGSRNKAAQQNFTTDDFSKYALAVTWAPKFDGLNSDPKKAEEYSLFVSTTTNYQKLPHFIIALSSAVLELDPLSPVAANNFAAAILTSGLILTPPKSNPEAIAAYQKDAESGFLYAIAVSMKDIAWTEESFTAILNLGNLYLDMGRLEEARSLFLVARKISPYSWDAALGLAAYFHAIHQPDKALAIMEDDDLDRPEKYLQAVKSTKSLEKSDKYTDLTLETPEAVYKEGIKIMASEPILTSADFVTQLDQSERNKMSYFIEHLAPEGSFKAPSIKMLTQFSSLKAISSAVGLCALKDFSESMAKFSLSTSAVMATQQMDMASRLGLNIELDFDLDDAVKHPEKYAGKLNDNSVKINGMQEFMSNVDNMQKQANVAERGLATKKTASIAAMGAKIDPFLAILQVDPDKYADPMNVIVQKHNCAVYNRKSHLYNGSIYSINNRIYQAVSDVVQKANKRIAELEIAKKAEIDALYPKSDKNNEIGRVIYDSAEYLSDEVLAMTDGRNDALKEKEHSIHVRYANQFNNTAEVAFNSSTNLIMPAYTQKIKPAVEAYYYDVIRHIALISDPEVRIQKEAELRSSINSSLAWSMHTILLSYGSFSYREDWDCGCDPGASAEARAKKAAAENARILKNKKAKAQFDTGEIPDASPLYKKIDSYGTDYDFGFVKGRISCAKTTVNVKFTLPLTGAPEFTASYKGSAFTKAATYEGGVKVAVKMKEADDKVSVSAYLNLSGSLTTDNKGSVKDYSVVAGTGLSVSAKGTTVSVGGEMSYGPKGLDSDMSAGVSRDFSNKLGTTDLGGKGKVSFEASTKTGCSLTGKVQESLSPLKSDVDKGMEKQFGKEEAQYAGTYIPSDKFFQKEFWSGKFTTK